MAGGQPRDGALRVPFCGGVIEESHKPATFAIGITRFSVGT